MMALIEVIASIVGLVATLLPKVVGGDTSLLERILRTAEQSLLTGGEALEKLQAIDAHLKEMVAQGRDPTEEEWSVLTIRAQSLHDEIQKIPF